MNRYACIIKHTISAEPVCKPENQCCFAVFPCLFQSMLEKVGFLAEQGEQKSTEQPTGLLSGAENNSESTSILQKQTNIATNHP